jgi:hypothetical protein
MKRRASHPLTSIIALIAFWVVGRSLVLAVGLPLVDIKVATNPKPARPASVPHKSGLAFISAVTSAYAAPRLWNENGYFTPVIMTSHQAVHIGAPPLPQKFVTRQQTKERVEATSLVSLQPTNDPAATAIPRQAMFSARSSAATPPIVPALFPPSGTPRRLGLSTWILWRPEGVAPFNPLAQQLGGSQAGARFSLPVLRVGKGATGNVYARVVTPLAQKGGKEMSVGTSLRIGKSIPVEISVERRLALSSGGRNAWAALVSSGVSDKSLGGAFTVNGYMQAGVVGLKSRDAFIDGEVNMMRALSTRSSFRPEIGVGLWGAAQTGIDRIDIGPVITVRPKIGGTTVRVSTSWRWRASGDVLPRSGIALSIGADF